MNLGAASIAFAAYFTLSSLLNEVPGVLEVLLETLHLNSWIACVDFKATAKRTMKRKNRVGLIFAKDDLISSYLCNLLNPFVDYILFLTPVKTMEDI